MLTAFFSLFNMQENIVYKHAIVFWWCENVRSKEKQPCVANCTLRFPSFSCALLFGSSSTVLDNYLLYVRPLPLHHRHMATANHQVYVSNGNLECSILTNSGRVLIFYLGIFGVPVTKSCEVFRFRGCEGDKIFVAASCCPSQPSILSGKNIILILYVYFRSY